MTNALNIIYLAFLLASTIVVLFYSRYLGKWGLSIMAWYLPAVMLMELYLNWLLYIKGLSTAPTYNVYRPLTVLVFGWIYYQVPFMVRFRPMMLTVTAIYLCVVIGSYIFIPSTFTKSNLYLTLARGFCVTFFAVCFLIGLLLLDKTETEIFWRPLIWVTIGVMTFYPVTSLSLGFQNQLHELDATIFGHKLYQAIPQVMSIFMYSFFAYAFYLCKKTN
jgi:hypothetical protein